MGITDGFPWTNCEKPLAQYDFLIAIPKEYLTKWGF